MAKKADPLKPDAALLCTLGSAIIHAQEFASPTGSPVDQQAFNTLLANQNVVEWMAGMASMSLLPVMRTPETSRVPSMPNGTDLDKAREAAHRKGDSDAVGWANDAIHVLQRFVAGARRGQVDFALLEHAEDHIETAREDME